MDSKSHTEPIALPVLKFGEDRGFERELHDRVNAYFNSAGMPRTATPFVYIKALIVLVSLITSYLVLVFVADTIWQGIVFAAILGFSIVGVGVNLQHDGSHNAFSKHQWVNTMMALSMDGIGASSYFWRWKHNRFHHTFTNIVLYDTDIDLGSLGRIAPSTKRLWFHRWQHIYLWFFYGLVVIKWQLFDDFFNAIRGRLGRHRIPRPHGMDLFVFLIGKGIFITWAFAIPLLVHPFSQVIFYYILVMVVAGISLSMIFILPHGVEEAEFPVPEKDTGGMVDPRAVHQVRVTVDFSRKDLLATWLVGGLNFHREHHLFPSTCHIHYPHIAGIVDEVCAKFGIHHIEHKSYLAGLRSHYHWLRRMGGEDEATTGSTR